MNTGHGTYIEANIPWLTEDDGYVSKVKGQLLLVDCTTSLQYRSLIECETFEVQLLTDSNRSLLAYHMNNICAECFGLC